jgi:hypothetical protein
MHNSSYSANEMSLEVVSTTNAYDLIAALIKASTSLLDPYFGPYLAELVGMVIPNQKLDRLIKYVTELDKRVVRMEKAVLREQDKNEAFTDLMEEGLRQAAQSLSDERREYIASLVANGIASTEIEYHESKHLLRLLGELNDIELILLRAYSNSEFGSDEEFREKHHNVICPVSRAMGQDEIVYDKAAIHDSYKEHLSQTGFLSKKIKLDQKTGLPVIDRWSGGFEIYDYQITRLGRLLLRRIGLVSEDYY